MAEEGKSQREIERKNEEKVYKIKQSGNNTGKLCDKFCLVGIPMILITIIM